MNRKEFILKSAITAFSISIFGKVLPSNAENNETFEGDCDTTNDILGPFYRPDSPERRDLTSPSLEGNVVEVKGRVYGEDCVTPLRNAMVEIWHCNTHGEYDNDSTDFHQRAKWYTDSEGAYSFKTILPGKYLNGGKYRPAHIHFRVTSPGNKELVSQIYFHGDPLIANDPWASLKKAEKRILPISLGDTNGNLMVNFDIYLGKH